MTMTIAPETETRTATRPRWLVPAMAAVALLAALVVGLGLFGGDDPAAEPQLSSLPDAPRGVGDEAARELLDLLEAGRALTFHAVYETSSTDPEAPGAVTVEIWRDGGRVRQDSVVEAAGQRVHTAAIREPDGTVTSCLQRDGEAWSCGAAGGAPEGDLFGSVTAQLEGATVTVTDERIGDLAVRCFTIVDAVSQSASELCLTPDGIPVRISAGEEAVLDMTSLERQVDSAVFTPPGTTTSA
jgi:hypothetical protein